jgi:hypothetical protein
MASRLYQSWAVRAAAVFALAACLAVAAPVGAQQSPGDTQDIALEPLEPQELSPGRCGLFLWSKDAQPILVLVALANPVEARVRTNGRNRYLRRISFGKELVYGHFERQVFTDGRLNFEVDIQFDVDRELRNGAVVKAGVIRTSDTRTNWQSITPVGGLVACQDNAPAKKR